MLRNNLVKLALPAIFTLFIVASVFALNSTTHYYSCPDTAVATTVIDAAGKGYYDTYIIKWCDNTTETLPISYGTNGIVMSGTIMDDEPTLHRKPRKGDKTGFTETIHQYTGGPVQFYWDRPAGADSVYYQPANYQMRQSFGNDNSEATMTFAVTPNPAINQVRIHFTLPNSARVQLRVLNETGTQVAMLINDQRNAGEYDMLFDTQNLSSGVYLVQATIGNSVIAKKLVVTK